MLPKAASFVISVTIILCLCYESQCNNLTTSASCIGKTVTETTDNGSRVICSQDNCTKSCLCMSPVGFDICSQSCNESFVCPSVICNTTLECNQNALSASNVPYLYCNSTEKCQQIVSQAFSERMVSLSRVTNQVYTNKASKLTEMVCRSTDVDGVCDQSCDFCNTTSCSARICGINCTQCDRMTCDGSSSCKTICNRQCNTTICQSPNCNMVCEAGSLCSNIECGNGVTNCSLECRSLSNCSLNCGSARRCDHSCALDGLCYTRGPQYIDKHNGQCGMCNCSRDVRNCVQRCQSQSGRCLGLYCDASSRCEQYSKLIGKSFVLFMISTSPVGKQVCYNGSDCWHMLCYGLNCSLTCESKATCGHMLCNAENCSFHCKPGAVCDVLTCLPGSKRCEYFCEAGSNCRITKCQGEVCVGTKRYVIAASISLFGERNIFLRLLLLLLILYVVL